MAIEVTPIPEAELNLFKQLKDLKVIFDVGARVDIEYLNIWPDSQHHLFEPNPIFAEELLEKVHGKLNVFTNVYGLGDTEELRGYYTDFQAFADSGACGGRLNNPHMILPIKTLDWYVKKNNIKQIDFLKIDTEGHDMKVISGAKESWSNIRFIQYEHWGERDDKYIRNMIKDYFDCESIGYRNIFCMNKFLVKPEEREELLKYIAINKLSELS